MMPTNWKTETPKRLVEWNNEPFVREDFADGIRQKLNGAVLDGAFYVDFENLIEMNPDRFDPRIFSIIQSEHARARQEWGTPPDLWDVLNAEFDFQLDAAATAENALCERFIMPEMDARAATWVTDEIRRVYCNPGFSKMEPWISKAIIEAARYPNAVVVMMGLCAPSTKWYGWAYGSGREIRDLSPRPQFIPAPGVKSSSNAKENSLYVFRGKAIHGQHANVWRYPWKELSNEEPS